MSYAPDTLKAARQLYMECLAKAGYKIDPASVGIVGDDAHAASGTSYHLGKDALKANSYSVVESSRDRNGLTDAASALDLGWFDITVGGKRHTLRTLSAWLVAQCQAGAPDTADIREIIYSPDGKVVKRWDRLGKRTSGDDSHLSHTHLSRFRDAENRTSFTALLRRYFTEIGVLEDTVDAADIKAIATETVNQMFAHKTPDFGRPGRPDLTLQQWIGYSEGRAQVSAVLTAVTKLQATADAVLKNVVADDGDAARIMAEVDARAAELAASIGTLPASVVAALAQPGAPVDDIVAALRTVLGDRASAVFAAGAADVG